MTARALTAIVLLLGISAPAAFAAEGEALRGQAIAQQQCARCHDVAKGGAFKKMPPSFQAIAIYRTKPDI